MIRSKSQKNYTPITGINITPFTDICLVLLIIFMVTASTASQEKSVPLNLPKAASSDTALPKSVTVKITRNQQVYVNDIPVKSEELQSTLQRHYDERQVKILVVKADEQVPYQSVISAIDTARKVGIVEIALATRQPASVSAADVP